MDTKNKSVLDYLAAREAGNPQLASAVRAEFNKLEFARVLRQLREARGFSQAELAESLGTTQSAIARIESGRVVPKMDMVNRIVQALGGTWQSNFKAASGITLSLNMTTAG